MSLVAPFRALVVAMAGVLGAIVWYRGQRLWLLTALPLGTVGYGLDYYGRTRLLPDRPTAARLMMEWWLLYLVTLAALISALAIGFAVALTSSETAPTETKKIYGALGYGIGAFLVAIVASLMDRKGTLIPEHFRKAFQSRYARYESGPDLRYDAAGRRLFRAADVGHPDASDAERWVFSGQFKGADGWGRPSRSLRAHGIAQELQSSESDQLVMLPRA